MFQTQNQSKLAEFIARMPTYKFRYFGIKARGEPMRLLMAYGDIPYEDDRVQFPDWPKIKPTLPFRTLPVLEIDDKVINQSRAILKYLAKKTGLNGSNDLEECEIDMYAGGVDEFFPIIGPHIQKCARKDPEAPAVLKQINETKLQPDLLPMWEGFLAKSTTGFLVNDKVSYADLMLFNILDILNVWDSSILSKFPKLQLALKAVGNLPELKAYLAKRPNEMV